AEGPFAQERLGSRDYLALRDFRGPSAPPCRTHPTLTIRVHTGQCSPAIYHVPALVAQRLERRTFTPRDAGSIPAGGIHGRDHLERPRRRRRSGDVRRVPLLPLHGHPRP